MPVVRGKVGKETYERGDHPRPREVSGNGTFETAKSFEFKPRFFDQRPDSYSVEIVERFIL